jgi:hypothetical protein
MDGWEGQFTVLGDLRTLAYPGMKCHFYAPVYYDGSRLTDNDAFIDVFVGYLTEITVTAATDRVKRSVLLFKGPLKLARLLPSATQFFEEVTTPSQWTEVEPGLSDPAYASYYIYQYHTTMLDNHDLFYESDIRLLRRRVFGFPADNISAHTQLVGLIMRGNVGGRSDGSITLTQEPSLQSTTLRNARDEKFTWTDASVRDRAVIKPTFRPKIAYLIMRAVAYDGNTSNPMIAYASKAPGYAQEQGVTKTNLPDISITVNGGAAELYAVTGHQFALNNNPLAKFDTFPAKMLDIAEPADPDWHVFNVSESTYLPIDMDRFGVRWASDMRMRPVRVTRTWTRTRGVWVKQITQQNRIESFGQPGVFHPTFAGEIAPYIDPFSGWLLGLDITMPDIVINFDSVSGGLPSGDDWGFGWALNEFGISGWSTDWNGTNPSYTSVNQALAGDAVSQTLEGDGSGAAWLVMGGTDGSGSGDEGNSISIFYNPDIESNPTDWTWDLNRALFYDYNRAIIYSSVVSGVGSMLWIVQDPTKVYSWAQDLTSPGWLNNTVGLGNGATEDPNSGLPCGVAIGSGTKQWASGREDVAVANIAYRVFYAPAFNWSAIANHPNGGYSLTPIPMIARGGTNIYVTYAGVSAPNTPKLYRIDDATTTWTDITPTGDYAPVLPNAFVINGTNIQMIGTDPNGNRHRWSSTNSGTSWTDEGETPYSWLVRLSSDAVWCLGGSNLLDVTNDTFQTFHDRLGQWGTIGSIGVMTEFTNLGLV